MENKTDVYASLGDKRKKFMSWQTRTILVTMIGYAIFYFVRKNFSLAMPGLTAEYGISNKSFGWDTVCQLAGLRRIALHQRLCRRPCKGPSGDGSGLVLLRSGQLRIRLRR